jgi:hypothetical protein
LRLTKQHDCLSQSITFLGECLLCWLSSHP